MIQRDAARIILGGWLSGKHREHIKEIPPAEFGDYAPIASVLRTGETDPLRIARLSKVKPSIIGELTGDYYDALYTPAVREVLRARRVEWLAENPAASPEKIREHLRPEEEIVAEPAMPRGFIDQFVEYNEALDRRSDESVMLTGIEDLDELTGGIHRGDLVAIGARPSTGKTAFCLQVASNVALSGGRVLFFSLEMPVDQIMDRIVLQYASGFEQEQLRSGRLSNEQREEIQEIGTSLSEGMTSYSFSTERNIEAIERIVEATKPDFIVIDQLSQLSSKTGFDTVRARFSYMTRELKRIAMENDTAIWLACQLNRNASEDKRPTMDLLKESGSIEEDSDAVILLWRDKNEEEARPDIGRNRIITAYLDKHRNGSTGDFQMVFEVSRFMFRPGVPRGFYRATA